MNDMDTLPGDEAPKPDDLIGRQIGQYKIVRELGRGGMATVYLASQSSMSRQVAIKVLPREFMHGPQFIQRFKREVRLIAELEHPHILPVYDFGEIEGIPYIVMRYLGGGSMRDLLSQGLPPLAKLERPMDQVCQALDFAHAEGIIHRDLKPSNIMLDERGNAYLSDFGIAQIMQDAGKLTGSAVIGTPAYMSPEQAEGRPLDARSDVYAMGVVLFELVTGREPFHADTPMAMLLKQITEPMPSPRAYRPDLPPAVETVILKATLKDPSGRYPAAGDFGAAFHEALRGLTVEQKTTQMPLPKPVEKTFVPAAGGPQLHVMETDAAGEPAPESSEYEPTVIGGPDRPGRVPTAAHRAEATVGRAAPTASRSRTGLWLGLAALVVVILAAVGLLASGVLGGETTTIVTTVAAPTPFPGADTHRSTDRLYQLSVPGDWVREDHSSAGEVAVLWSPGPEAFAALRVYNVGESRMGRFGDLVTSYAETYFGDARYFTPLSSDEAETLVRRSYRLPQPQALYDRYGGGQFDVFFEPYGSYLFVLEVFTADDADLEALLPTLQQVLDSLYVNPGVAWGSPGAPVRGAISLAALP
ncbi:MAG: serine/threonine protein kinase [Anaerolineae bacterium]|nr:serine/threonine protein kinase [Anaerolineae bacterium]